MSEKIPVLQLNHLHRPLRYLSLVEVWSNPMHIIINKHLGKSTKLEDCENNNIITMTKIYKIGNPSTTHTPVTKITYTCNCAMKKV